MKTLVISPKATAATQESRIYVGAGLLARLAALASTANYSSVFIITDEVVASHWLGPVEAAFSGRAKSFQLPAGESAKHIETVQRLWHAMLQAGCDRKSLVVNVGGGVITDLGGFAASTYMRGIDFVNVPTTLLAQVDASVGGKTGIDFAGIKNLVGTFSQPKAVVMDVATLTTLPDREFIAGFAEIIKHGLIADRAYYDRVTSKGPRDFSADELTDIIYRSCEIKADIAAKDPTETGLRKLANHGHTIGHALEACSLETPHPLLHGEAIAIGMLAEAKLAQLEGMLSEAAARRIQTDLQHAGLPVICPQMDEAKLMQKMSSDKKNENGAINFTLLKQIGEAAYNQTASDEHIRQALASVMEPA